MAHSVPPEILYSSYWYRSGTNQTMRDHLKGIVKAATAMVDFRVLLNIEGSLLLLNLRGLSQQQRNPAQASFRFLPVWRSQILDRAGRQQRTRRPAGR